MSSRSDHFINPKLLPSLFSISIWVTALFSLCQAQWTRMHLGLPPDWYSMSFYFFIPALLWVLTYPLITACYYRLELRKDSPRNWLTHISISITLAATLKFLSLFIDFYLKTFQGQMDIPFSNFLATTRYLFIGSCFENMVIYWLVIGALHLTGPRRSKLYPDHLFVKDDSTTIRINVTDIQLVEAFGNYLKIYLPDRLVCSRGTIKSIVTELNPIAFTRVHRSYIVNNAAVKKIKRGRTCHVEMNDGRSLVVGDRFRDAATKIFSPS